jgi:hypothetical protein
MVEGSEFELSVPVSKLPDDSTMLEIATARRLALRAQTTSCRRYSAFDERISPMRDIRIPPGEPRPTRTGHLYRTRGLHRHLIPVPSFPRRCEGVSSNHALTGCS